jgi:hypothetical protein
MPLFFWPVVVRREDKMVTSPGRMKQFVMVMIAVPLLICFARPVFAVDSRESRMTLTGLRGVYVAVEEMQSNVMKYEKHLHKSGLTPAQIQQDVARRLREEGIRVLTQDEWLNTPGRPVLYVNINTHENEKYWLAYDVRLEVQLLVSLDSNPRIKTLASTWAINMTGMVDIGNLNVLRDNILVLVNRFVEAYTSVNIGR